MVAIFSGDVQTWILMPALIFCARMTDVTLGTIRIVLISRGQRSLVPLVGFFEVLIWVVAVAQLMQHLSNVLCYIAWPAGYAMGAYVGLLIEERLAIGNQVIRVITSQDPTPLLEALRQGNHGYTVIDGRGAKGPVTVVFTVIERRVVNEVVALIERHVPSSFFSTEDVRKTGKGVFSERLRRKPILAHLMLPLRKAK